MRKKVILLVYVFLIALITQTCTKLEDETEQSQRDSDYKLVQLTTDNVEKITVVDTVKYMGRNFPVYDITITGSAEEINKIELGKVIYVHKEGEGGKVVLVTEIKSNTKSAPHLKGGVAMAILGIQATLDMYFNEEKSELFFSTTSNRSRNNTKIENKIIGADPYSITNSDFKFEIKPKDSLSVEVTSKPGKLFQSKLSGTLWQSADTESSITLNGSLSLHPSFDLHLKYEPKQVKEGSGTYSSVLSWLEAAAVPDIVMAQYKDKDYLLGNMKQIRTNVYTDVDFDLSFVIKLAKKFELKPKPKIPFARLIVVTPTVTTFTDAAFELDLSVLAAGEFELTGGTTNDLVLGVNLDKALSDAVWYYDYDNNATGSAKLKGKVELTAGISIVFDTEVYVFGLFGPHFKAGPVIEAKATANAVYDMNDGLAYDWKFAVDYGINGEASLDLSLFHLDAATTQLYKMENIEIRRNLYTAPDSIKVISGDKQEGTEGQKLPLPIKVGVYDTNKNLVKYLPVPVYFKTDDGSVNPKGPILTDDKGYASTEWTLGTGKEEQTMEAFLKEEGKEKSKIEITAKAEKDSSFIDPRDGRKYKIVTIGKQTWLAENLAYEIPGKQITNNDAWQKNSAYDAWCYYDNDKETYGSKYGVLYQWEAAKTACPPGWHLPSSAEWYELMDYLALNGYNFDGSNSGNKFAKAMAATYGWYSSPTIANIGSIGLEQDKNNRSGFSALPGGKNGEYGFKGLLENGYWWGNTQSEIYSNQAMFLNLYYNFVYLAGGNIKKINGYNVRCIRD